MTAPACTVRRWEDAPILTGRLLRATTMTVTPYGQGTYHVASFGPAHGEKPHWVNLTERDVPLCDCEDATYREETLCAHGIAALLWEANPRVCQALIRQLVLSFREGRLGLVVLPGPERR